MLSNCAAGEHSWESPWTTRRSDQSILQEISPEHSLEGLMPKLKLQYFGHLTGRANSLEKTHADKDWGQEKGVTEDEMVGWHHPLTSKKLRTTVNFVQISSKFLSTLSFKIQTPSHHSDKSEFNPAFTPAHKPSHSKRKRAAQGVPISPLYRVSSTDYLLSNPKKKKKLYQLARVDISFRKEKMLLHSEDHEVYSIQN